MQKIAFVKFASGRQTLTPVQLPLMKKVLALPAYHWLMLALATLIFPHMGGVPTWLLVLLVVSVIMQKPSIKHTINQTGKQKRIYQVLQHLIFIGGIVGIWFTFGQIFGVDVAVSFLVLCLIGKSWEIYQKRDAYVLVNLGLFVLASSFLMRQDLGVALVGLPSLLMLLMTFIALSDEESDGQGRLRSLMILTVPAIPLLVVLFLFFPRISPLWSLPMAGKSASTGVSDTMSPGDFSDLSQSTELAFRVEFDGKIPPRHEMYWRGLVLSDFNGKTWRQNDFSEGFWSSRDAMPSWAKDAYANQVGQDYQVILEPTQQNWLFALDYPKANLERGMGMTSDFTLRNYSPIATQKRYRATVYKDVKVDLTISDTHKKINLRLPKQGNPQSRAFAQELFAKNHHDPILYIQAIKQHIVSGGFSYTLSPPTLNDNRIDEFLFGSKAGFCEHYASTFAFLMREVGIPARIVGGYQGGELGRDGQSWEVRQMDAHAWTEVWLDGRGWVRIDPTAFVSPERIDSGMNAVTEAGGASLFGDGLLGRLSYEQFKFLQTLRRYSDQASYYWQRDVVGYDQNEQKKSLSKWFNISNFAEQFWTLVGGVLVLTALFLVITAYRRRKRHHPLDMPLVQLQKRLIKQHPSLVRTASEPYLSWLDRVNDTINRSDDIAQLKAVYRQHRYGKDADSKLAINELNRLVKRVIGKGG
ncbi:transglutaminase family protein [Moraxella oblonga]|uniref:transglutaminase family protein n=1 Tax=Moraxella oblonga TaxID=200413 RepID=UPI00083316A6|nr:DUF3488 and transglutaminase-like domain-containing protein [Moraxella oblonga]